jgi:hypothetical protein
MTFLLRLNRGKFIAQASCLLPKSARQSRNWNLMTTAHVTIISMLLLLAAAEVLPVSYTMSDAPYS